MGEIERIASYQNKVISYTPENTFVLYENGPKLSPFNLKFEGRDVLAISLYEYELAIRTEAGNDPGNSR